MKTPKYKIGDTLYFIKDAFGIEITKVIVRYITLEAYKTNYNGYYEEYLYTREEALKYLEKNL